MNENLDSYRSAPSAQPVPKEYEWAREDFINHNPAQARGEDEVSRLISILDQLDREGRV